VLNTRPDEIKGRRQDKNSKERKVENDTERAKKKTEEGGKDIYHLKRKTKRCSFRLATRVVSRASIHKWDEGARGGKDKNAHEKENKNATEFGSEALPSLTEGGKERDYERDLPKLRKEVEGRMNSSFNEVSGGTGTQSYRKNPHDMTSRG